MLVVDATQGVEAQTVANTYMAWNATSSWCPLSNKIDLPSAHPDEVAQEMEDGLGHPRRRCGARVSGKTGEGIHDLLERVVQHPRPHGDPDAPLKALIFDRTSTATGASSLYPRV